MAQSGASDQSRSMIKGAMRRGASWDVRSREKSEPLIFTWDVYVARSDSLDRVLTSTIDQEEL